MAYFGYTQPFAANEQQIVGPHNTDRADNISGAVFSDQAGHLFVEQSGDGQHWDLSKDITVAVSTGAGFSEPLYLPYVRLRYVNGGTASTATRIFARFTSAGDS